MQLAMTCDSGTFEQLEPLVAFERWDLSHGEFAEIFRRLVRHFEHYGWSLKLKTCYGRGGEDLCDSK